MKDPKEKEALQNVVNRGNLADIALRETLSGYFVKKRTEKLNSLVAEFNANKTPGELMNVIASLAALSEMENELKGQVSRREIALNRIKEIDDESEVAGYREY